MAVPGDDLAVACERDCCDHLVEISDWLAVSPKFGSECAEDPVGLIRDGKFDQRLDDVVVPEGRGSRAGVAAVPVVGIGARKSTEYGGNVRQPNTLMLRSASKSYKP